MKEFEFLKYLKQHFNLGLIGDDCAVLAFGEEHDLLATSDLLVERTDFDLKWFEPSEIGHKAAAVSVSDIAAMGGAPLWALVSVALPGHIFEKRFLTEFYDGFSRLAETFGVRIAGGDVSGGTDLLCIDSVLLGRCAAGRAVMRNGASPGDLVFVSGKLGGAAAGLKLLQNARDTAELDRVRSHPAVLRQLKPQPQVELGKELSLRGLATSLIDLSDGLSSDLKHICEASGVGAAVIAESVPIDDSVLTYEVYSLPEAPLPLDLALNGGEDFELLFTADPSNAAECERLGCSAIGEILSDPSAYKLAADGVERPLAASGYEHFSEPGE